ncbi:RNA polymerase sigma factor [Cohnella soli]|uniref:RNA polymerase sigma factor n=1 Tax=Cohnella soli TaxID=425005 RepID=A0ABW0HRV9_9BACL
MEKAGGLDEVYAAYAISLSRFMYKLTRDREEANDLVQDAFLKLCEQGRVPDHPREWLNLTGYRLFVDRWRRRQRVVWTQLDDRAPEGRPGPEQEVLDRELDRHFRSLLLRFKPSMRTAIQMRVYDGRGYGEIARALGCSENTVKSFIRRGWTQLARWL